MRRVLAAVVAAAPALAAGQLAPSPGQVIPSDPPNADTVHGLYVDADECVAANGRGVDLSWSIPSTSFQPVYTVWASNRFPIAAGAAACDTRSNASTGFVVGPVGPPLAGAGEAVALQPYPTADFVTAAGFTCSDTSERSIFVCVEARDSATSASLGIAQVTLTLSTARPGAPAGVAVTPADGAVLVAWGAPSGGLVPYDYRVLARADPPDPRDAALHEQVVLAGALQAEVGGLVGGVTYRVQVRARSVAGSEGGPAEAVGTPLASEPPPAPPQLLPRPSAGGGCGSGGGRARGPGALLAAAALLVARRRRA